MVVGRANPIPPMTSSDEENEVAISGDIHISSELPTINISSIKKKSEEEAAFSEEVNISSAPDYALPSSGEEAAELASPLPDQSPLDPEAFCMKFFQVIKVVIKNNLVSLSLFTAKTSLVHCLHSCLS